MARFSAVVAVGLCALGATACQTHEDYDNDGRADVVYKYVYDVEGDGGQITGGAHEVLIPRLRGAAREKIDAANMPSRLHPQLNGAEYKKFDETLKEGHTDFDVFASNWWPQSSNGIAKRWTGGNGDYNDHSELRTKGSPAEKMDVFLGHEAVTVAEVKNWSWSDYNKPEDERPDPHVNPEVTVAGPITKWEMENHGNYQHNYRPDSWWGHCNGWASYATAETGGAPARDIWVKLVDDKVTECEDGENDESCVFFRMGDIEAMMSELYFSDKATFAGRRCNTEPDEMERDEYGRPTDDACRDLNAGSFHIAITGLLGKGAKYMGGDQKDGHPAFIIDYNYDHQVWNYPVSDYEIVEIEDVESAEAAAALVGAEGEYEFNPSAKAFKRVRMYFWMVSDGVSDYQMLKHADERNVSKQKVELNYVLELDNNDHVVGGEWIKRPEAYGQDSKKLHPDFFWMAMDHNGYGESSDDLGGNDDNPHLPYSTVKALLDCANDAATCAPTTTDSGTDTEPSGATCADHCGNASPAPGSDPACYCDDVCKQYGDCCEDKEDVCNVDAGDDSDGGDASTDGGSADPEPAELTCKDHCGDSNAVVAGEQECFCDDVCLEYGDCCGDFQNECQ